MLVSFICVAFAVQAETRTVTDLSQLSNDKVYAIRSARAFLMYSSASGVSGQICSSTGKVVGTVTQDPTDVNQQFRIENNNGSYYLYSMGAEKYVDAMFRASRLLGKEPITISDVKGDALVEFSRMFNKINEKSRQYAFRNLSNAPQIEQYYRPYMRALREWDKDRAFYPDANFTLRVAYGTVAGYEYADAEYHHPVSTIDGIMAKDDPNVYDYNIPQVLRDIYAAKDYGRWGQDIYGKKSVAVCFLATNHTSGGNSGSPVINGKGELIGINFDRTWRSTMSDMEFDPTICRNISVDIRYVLFVIDRIGGASYLFDEMTLK